MAPASRPTPGHYHVLYRGCGETQLGWHGETYCLVGGYRLYGDVPLATPAKVEAEKPVPRRAPKRKHSLEWSDEDLGCPRPKIRRLELSSSTGIQGALIVKQGGPTSGHIASARATVNECPIFAFSRSAAGSQSPPKEGSLSLPHYPRLPQMFLPGGLIRLRAELFLCFSESHHMVLVTPLHPVDHVFHGGCR